MADPKLEEFCRAHDFKPNFLRDMQRYLRDEIQPKLEERERLLDEVSSLKAKTSREPKVRPAIDAATVNPDKVPA